MSDRSFHAQRSMRSEKTLGNQKKSLLVILAILLFIAIYIAAALPHSRSVAKSDYYLYLYANGGTFSNNEGTFPNGSNSSDCIWFKRDIRATTVVLTGSVQMDDSLQELTITRPGYIFAGWNTEVDGTGNSVTTYPADIVIGGREDMSFYAQWRTDGDVFGDIELTEVTHTVTFDPNGASGPVASLPANSGLSITLPISSDFEFAYPGFTFIGWSTSPDSTGDVYAPGAAFGPVTADTAFYAAWKKNGVSFTLKYSPNGGKGSGHTATIYEGGYISVISDSKAGFTRAGYAFAGWNTKADGSGKAWAADGLFGPVNANTTLYAQWGEILPGTTSTLTYSPNGGSGKARLENVKGGKKVKISNASALGFEKSGHTFVSWNTKADGSGTKIAAGAEYGPLNGNITLYAQYKKDAVAVRLKFTYSPNGGTGSASVSYVDKGSTLTAPSSSSLGFSNSGLVFAGWNTSASGNGVSVAAGSAYGPINSDTTLYAQWRSGSAIYTLNYEPNGGSGTARSESVQENSYVTTRTVGGAGFSRSGYSFTGWNTKADGTGSAYNASSSLGPFNASVTLYAQWVTDGFHTVTYHPNTGSGGAFTKSYREGTAVSIFTIADAGMSKTDCTFDSWNTHEDGSGTSYAQGSQISLTGSLTLYAQWKSDRAYTVTYYPNGGTGTAFYQIINAGRIYTVRSIEQDGFAKPGSVFTGWNTSPFGNGTQYDAGAKIQLSADIVLYAQWERPSIPVSIIYFAGVAGGDPSAASANSGSLITLKSVQDLSFAYPGYIFESWNSNPDGSGKSYSAGQRIVAPESGLTLYAQWARDPSASNPTVTINYAADNGTGSSYSQTVGINEPWKALDDAGIFGGLNPNGPALIGWNMQPDGLGTFVQPGVLYYPIMNNLTLYPVWADS